MTRYLIVRPSSTTARMERSDMPLSTPKAMIGWRMSGSAETPTMPATPLPCMIPIIFVQAGELKTVGNCSLIISTPWLRNNISRAPLPTVAPMALASAVLLHARGRPRTAARKSTTVAAVNTSVKRLTAVPKAASHGNHGREANCSIASAILSAKPFLGSPSVGVEGVDFRVMSMYSIIAGIEIRHTAKAMARFEGKSLLVVMTITGQGPTFAQPTHASPGARQRWQLGVSQSFGGEHFPKIPHFAGRTCTMLAPDSRCRASSPAESISRQVSSRAARAVKQRLERACV
mmetsp:Transcript_42811/g.91375  ORF Transcript_42811/g.91375 Transcript_42811/m.91375 type:complete len:289 (+) Transcript_42811:940-1806(+)